MSLLSRMLVGGVAAAADTTANIMVSNNNARIASERDQANALREENLMKMRQTMQDQSSEKEFTRNQTADLAKEERTFSRGESGMVNAEGVPLTRAEAEAVRKQDTAAAEAGPVKPGLISSAKYNEENTISKDFVAPDGKLISVAEAKQRQKEGLPLKMREDLEHERALAEKDADYKRGRKDKDEDRKKDLDEYGKKKQIDTAAELKVAAAKQKEAVAKVTQMTPSTAASVAAGLLAKKAKAAEEGAEFDAESQMLLDLSLKRAQGDTVLPPKKDPFAGSGKTTPIPPRGQQPKGLIQTAAPAAKSTRFVIKSVKQ